MNVRVFRQFFSAARVDRYLIATHNSTATAIKLYKTNLKISQTFHPLLGIFEVIFRNRINDTLTAYFADPDWIINQKVGFMSDPSLRIYIKELDNPKSMTS